MVTVYNIMGVCVAGRGGADVGSICGMAQHNTNEETIAVPLQKINGMGGGAQFKRLRLWDSVLPTHGQSLHE